MCSGFQHMFQRQLKYLTSNHFKVHSHENSLNELEQFQHIFMFYNIFVHQKISSDGMSRMTSESKNEPIKQVQSTFVFPSFRSERPSKEVEFAINHRNLL